MQSLQQHIFFHAQFIFLSPKITMIIENRKCDLNHDLASLFIPWLMRSLNSSDSANSIAPRDTQPWPRQRRIITPPHNSKVTECSVVIAAVSEGNNAYISVFQANEEPWIMCLRKQTGRRSSASPVKPKYDSMDSISEPPIRINVRFSTESRGIEWRWTYRFETSRFSRHGFKSFPFNFSGSILRVKWTAMNFSFFIFRLEKRKF